MALPVFDVFLHLGVLKLPSDQPFESENGVSRINDCLTFCRETNEALSVFCEGDNRRSRPLTFGVFNDSSRLSLHDRDT